MTTESAPEASDVIDLYRHGDTYRRESDRIERLLAEAAAPRSDLLEDWLEFGRHNWLWQLVHRKPSSRRAR